MASQQLLGEMQKVLQGLKEIDRTKLLRPSIGEASLQQAGFEKTLDRILKRAAFACEYGADVDDSTFNNLTNMLNSLRVVLSTQAARRNDDYVQQKASFTAQVNSSFNQMSSIWISFIVAGLESRGLLDEEDFRKIHQESVAGIKAATDTALRRVQEEANKTVEAATKIAKEIEAGARRTAEHISVKDAQDQFREAQRDADKKVKWWAVCSVSSIVLFLIVATYLFFRPPDVLGWHIVYFTAIRITILTAVGAVATFCLKILRAQMHMSQHNRHRQRVANSMQAFVEAASTAEQRDLILAALVNAIANFGTSGLIAKEDDAIYAPRLTIDSIAKFAQPSGKA